MRTWIRNGAGSFPRSISEYLLKTMRVNFDLHRKVSALRLQLDRRQPLPADEGVLSLPTTQRSSSTWTQDGGFPAGSSMEEGDVNLPSAEAIIRQVLYGNTYFRKEFGKASAEYMLPDCFGFPASLPSILAHAGVKGFSTQKLSSGWQPAPQVGGPDSPEQTPMGIPFNVGIWEGPDGKTVLAALNPRRIRFSNISHRSEQRAAQRRRARRRATDWVKRIELDGKVTGVYADYHYVGTGDIGGADAGVQSSCWKPWSPRAKPSCPSADAAAGVATPTTPRRHPVPP